MGIATEQMCRALNEIRVLRSALAALDTLQGVLWADTTPDVEYLKTASIFVRKGRERLKSATDACSYLQSELNDLQTALSGQEIE